MKVKHAERRKKPSESGSDLEDYSGMDCLVTSLPVKGQRLSITPHHSSLPLNEGASLGDVSRGGIFEQMN